MSTIVTLQRPKLKRTHKYGISCDGSCRNNGIPTSPPTATSCIIRYATQGPTSIVPSSSNMRSQYPPHSLRKDFLTNDNLL